MKHINVGLRTVLQMLSGNSFEWTLRLYWPQSNMNITLFFYRSSV